MPMAPVSSVRLHDAGDERSELAAATLTAAGPDRFRKRFGVDDPDMAGILEVVADVGDPVGPAHDLTLGSRRCRPGPGVVADAVERLGAQVERPQDHVGAPHGVVVALVDVRAEGVLRGVAARPVTAVVSECDRLGQRDVEPGGPGDRGRDLRDLERVGQPGALMVLGEHEHLGLPGEPAERRAVNDPVAIAFEAGSVRIGGLGDLPRPGSVGPGGPGNEQKVLGLLSSFPGDTAARGHVGLRVGVGAAEPRGTSGALAGAVALHGLGPGDGTLNGH